MTISVKRSRNIACASVSAVLSLCALSGWISGHLVLASFITGWKAMAPFTAFSVFLISVSLMAYNENKAKNRITFFTASGVIALLMIVAADRTGLVFEGFERSVIPAQLTTQISVVNTGVISPLTFFVLLISASVLILCSAVHFKIKHVISFACGFTVVFIGTIVVMGYILRNPILYGIISMPTGISFLFFGSSFILLSEAESFPARLLLGNNVGAIIMRRLFPLILLFIIMQGLFSNLPELFRYEKVFVTAVLIVILVVFSIIASVRVSSVIGNKIAELTDERDFARNEYVQSENKYETLVESLQEGIAILDMEGEILYSNPRMNEMFCAKPDNVERKKFFDFLEKGNNGWECYKNNLSSGKIDANDYEIIRSDGRRMAATVTIVPFLGSKSHYHGAIAGVVDITEKKCAEECLKESLANKEVLMRELFHRTKNNMQVICAFIRIKYYTLENGEQKEFLKSLENRILAMSLVHEKLYESKNLSRIDIESYTNDLCMLLISHSLSEKCSVGTVINTKGIVFPIEIATPYGLIMTECVMNSCKHAFKDKKTGTITINAVQKEDDMIELLYHDDGPGLPDQYNIKSLSSFGMKMISDLVTHQLHGSFEIDRVGGFGMRIIFRNSSADVSFK
jgi:PAS domain S-box-containing protein